MNNAEGELRVRLRIAHAEVSHCELSSTRPDVAALLLQGRDAQDILATVPRLFSLCAASQTAACSQALAAASSGRAVERPPARPGADEVAAEALRETALQVLLQWPRALGLQPSPQALEAARAARDGQPQGHAAIALAVFGMPAREWLMLGDASAWWDWAACTATAPARWLAAARADLSLRTPAVGLLPAWPDQGWWRELAQHAEGDPAFAKAPHWRGAAAETGALARQAHDPLVLALLATGARPAARFAARLRELAALLSGAAEITPLARVGGLPLGDGCGLGWAENARGRLLHLVRLRAGRALGYRIVAPTEWNFHPRGALVTALLGQPAGDPARLRQRAARWADSLDPCVACRIELDDDA